MTLEEKVNLLMHLCYPNLEHEVVTKLVDSLVYALYDIKKAYKEEHNSSLYKGDVHVRDLKIFGTEKFKLVGGKEFCIYYYTNIDKQTVNQICINEDNEYFEELLHLYNCITE